MIGECLSSLKVPSFLQNSIQIQNLPQPHISSAKTEKRVLKTPSLCVFSTLLTSDMFSYFPPKYNNFRLSQSTRNQFVGNTGTWVRIPPRPPKLNPIARWDFLFCIIQVSLIIELVFLAETLNYIMNCEK